MVKAIAPKASQSSAEKTKSKIKSKIKTKKTTTPSTKKVVVTKKKVMPKTKKTVKARKKVIKKTISKKRIISKKRKATKQKVAKNNIPIPSEIGGMKTASFIYLLTGVLEFVMAIPFLGWLIGISSFGFMLVAGIVLNIVAIVALVNRKKPIYANVIAIVANVFGVVPFLGWFLHLVATILLTILFFKEEKKN